MGYGVVKCVGFLLYCLLGKKKRNLPFWKDKSLLPSPYTVLGSGWVRFSAPDILGAFTSSSTTNGTKISAPSRKMEFVPHSKGYLISKLKWDSIWLSYSRRWQLYVDVVYTGVRSTGIYCHYLKAQQILSEWTSKEIAPTSWKVDKHQDRETSQSPAGAFFSTCLKIPIKIAGKCHDRAWHTVLKSFPHLRSHLGKGLAVREPF